MISIDVENIQNTLKENKRWHQEINELRNDIALLSNQESSFYTYASPTQLLKLHANYAV